MAAELFLTPAPALDSNGNPLSGAKWYFYATGTTTPQNVYSDATLSTSLGAVVTADSAGRFAEIYLDPANTYRGILKTSDGATTLYDLDPIGLGIGGAGGSDAVGYQQAGTGAVVRTVQDRLREKISVKDFGAVGDGSTDDTAAIQAAVDYAESIAGDHGATVIFPVGDYLHSNVVINTSGVILQADGNVRLLKSGTTGNGIEFKAPGYPGDPNARIYRCGFIGFTVGNKTANATAGNAVYFQNVQDATFENNRFTQYPYKPFTAFRFERCTNLTYTNNKGSDAVGTGVVFQECGGIFGNSNVSNVCGVDGYEFDSCTGVYLKTIQGYANVRYGCRIQDTIVTSTISDQAAYFLIESWDMDTNGDHNWSISDLKESALTNCWGSSQTGTTIDKVGFAFGGASSDVDLIGCKAMGNNGPGVDVGTGCTNINFIGGTFASNGKQAGSTNRVGIVHQGTGYIKGVTAKNITRYGTTQQYGLLVALGAASNPMRLEGNFLSGNATGPIVPITATNYTAFAESGNHTGESLDVASASDLTTPTLGSFFNVTGTTDIYNIKPIWKGRRVALTFASTARVIGGTDVRIDAANITPAQYGTAEFIHDGTRWVMLSYSINDNA